MIFSYTGVNLESGAKRDDQTSFKKYRDYPDFFNQLPTDRNMKIRSVAIYTSLILMGLKCARENSAGQTPHTVSLDWTSR